MIGGLTPSSIDGYEECQSIILVLVGLKCLVFLFFVPSDGLFTFEIALRVVEGKRLSNESSFRLSFCKGIVCISVNPVVELHMVFQDLSICFICFKELSWDENAFFSDWTLWVIEDSERTDLRLPPRVSFPDSRSFSSSFLRDRICEF